MTVLDLIKKIPKGYHVKITHDNASLIDIEGNDRIIIEVVDENVRRVENEAMTVEFLNQTDEKIINLHLENIFNFKEQ